MNITQIGLLLPTSTIFPIGKDFEKGLKDALGDAHGNVTIVKEFIGQGNIRQTEEAIAKLVTYDDVDVITGILSGKVTEYVAPKLLAAKKPFIVSELGEYILNLSHLNNYVFVNSHHLWRHAWAMGYWGVKNWGKKGMFIGSVYDTAYSFAHMFNVGMMAADPTAEWSFSVPPNPPPGQLSDMSVIFPYLEQYQPDFVFAAFCGTEATLFLNEFIRKGWHKKVKLAGLPFLVAPFAPLEDDITIYTTLPDSTMPQMAAKESFYYLGHRAGTIIAESLGAPTIYEGLKDNSRMMPVDGMNFVMNNSGDNDTVTIVENIIQANQPVIAKQETVATTPTFAITGEKLGSLLPQVSTGWLNPYLCI